MAELNESDSRAIPRVVSILSHILQKVAEGNDAAHRPPALYLHGASAFQGLTKPGISVRSYLERIFRYANCSPACYVVAYIYLDRYTQRQAGVFIDSFNVHRFLITSVLTAVKFMDDITYNNAYYAKVGGITLMEMNYMEVDFLFGMDFKLNVTPMIFNSYCSILQREMSLVESPRAPPGFHCCSTEEERQKKQLAA